MLFRDIFGSIIDTHCQCWEKEMEHFCASPVCLEFDVSLSRSGEVTDDFIETKLTKMVKYMREFGALNERERDMRGGLWLAYHMFSHRF
jgi:hypothetical protein